MSLNPQLVYPILMFCFVLSILFHYFIDEEEKERQKKYMDYLTEAAIRKPMVIILQSLHRALRKVTRQFFS